MVAETRLPVGMWWSVAIEVVGRNDWRYQKMLMVEQNVASMWLSIALEKWEQKGLTFRS